MKRILIIMLALCSCLSIGTHAFELEAIGPDTAFLESLNRNVTEDIEYLREIAFSYKDRFVVTEEESVDISSIDKFYRSISSPLALSEIDSGKLIFDTDKVLNPVIKKEMNLFKIMGGLSGCKAIFEPMCYFRIYRNITLVGGYTRYEKLYDEAENAYWHYIYMIENMTKEIIPYPTRVICLEKIRQMYANMNADNHFKVFLLVDGEINSIWERGEDE